MKSLSVATDIKLPEVHKINHRITTLSGNIQHHCRIRVSDWLKAALMKTEAWNGLYRKRLLLLVTVMMTSEWPSKTTNNKESNLFCILIPHFFQSLPFAFCILTSSLHLSYTNYIDICCHFNVLKSSIFTYVTKCLTWIYILLHAPKSRNRLRHGNRATAV